MLHDLSLAISGVRNLISHAHRHGLVDDETISLRIGSDYPAHDGYNILDALQTFDQKVKTLNRCLHGLSCKKDCPPPREEKGELYHASCCQLLRQVHK